MCGVEHVHTVHILRMYKVEAEGQHLMSSQFSVLPPTFLFEKGFLAKSGLAD